MLITLKCKTGASSLRTRNRLKEHGPVFEFIKVRNPECFSGREGILVRSQKTDWLGWIEKNEVSIDPPLDLRKLLI